MFDFDAGKLILIGIVALIVIGPKDLPRVLRELGRAMGKMRRMATEFQGQFMEAVREADMADIKNEVSKLAESAKVDVPFNPVTDIKSELKDAVERASPAAALSAPAPAPPAVEAVALEAASGGEGDASPHEDARVEPGQDHAPDKGIDAEMQALADALKAEIGAAPKGEGHAQGRVSTLHDNA
jgi:sec-independent protein translocase protein TatB